MNPSTLFTTVSGRQVDLSCPKPSDIDFDDIAEHLAKEARYNGATPGAIYFVAQHLVLGADWILANAEPDPNYRAEWLEALRTGLPDFHAAEAPWLSKSIPPEAKLAAACYLLHDGEEGYLKDDTTPKKRAIDQEVQRFGVAAGVFREALAKIVERFNRAIYEAAGLPWPMPEAIEAQVHAVDAAMLATEWLALRPKHDLPQGAVDIAPLPIAIHPWRWEFAHELLADRMARLLPSQRVRG